MRVCVCVCVCVCACPRACERPPTTKSEPDAATTPACALGDGRLGQVAQRVPPSVRRLTQLHSGVPPTWVHTHRHIDTHPHAHAHINQVLACSSALHFMSWHPLDRSTECLYVQGLTNGRPHCVCGGGWVGGCAPLTTTTSLSMCVPAAKDTLCVMEGPGLHTLVVGSYTCKTHTKPRSLTRAC